ncbi:MAG TPA: FAD binding domain-containing protein [Trebonia sp.]|jgi:carbon-monoxide dehydrogenase medium subunit
MFPADFSYARARSLDEALDLLDEAAAAGEEAKLIAGGQSLLPMMKLRLAAPQVLIDIADLPELKHGGFYGHSHTIGALTTYRQLAGQGHVARDGTPALVNGTPALVNGATSLIAKAPALGDALAVLADPQVRARGTIGGAVAHGDPAADLSAVLLALDAEVVIAGRPGRHQHKSSQGHLARQPRPNEQPSNVERQTMLLDDFLEGIYATDLAEDEIITHVTITIPAAGASAYEKFPHPASHLPLAGVAVVLTFKAGTLTDENGRVTSLHDGSIAHAAIAVTGISPRPYRARAAEAVLKGAFPTADTLAAAAAQVTRTLDGTELSLLGDQHASAPYRAHLAEVLTRRALARAVARADAP